MPHIAPWFPDAKFGVFIHWVLKSVWLDKPEWRQSEDAESMFRENPRQFADHFTAEDYDPDQWAQMFADWGAKYAVLTTKHHIGFSLYDCPQTRFSAANSSPAGRDLVGPYVEALRRKGLKVGLYFSLPDWSHPNYASLAGGDDPRKYSAQDEPERWQAFLDDMFAEIRHLCTAYGKIDLMWFDGDWERTAEQWKTLELAAMIQQLQPEIILNNRLRHECLGHYGTPESAAPLKAPQGWWEYCTTPGDNWDGCRANENVKQPPELVRMFGDVLGMGGNLLLNVAPTAQGTLPDVQTSTMAGLGQWITDHAEAVYGSRAGLPFGLFNGSSTLQGSVLYLIAYDQPRTELLVKGLCSEVARVTHLTSGKELSWRVSGGRPKFGKPGWLFIDVPAECMDEHASVFKVEFVDDVLQIACPDGRTRTHRGRPALTEQETYEGRL